MYANTASGNHGSYTLTFLGKKVGRHHVVAPATKQRAWEVSNTSTSEEEPSVSQRPRQDQAISYEPDDLPGSVPQPRTVTHKSQFKDNTAVQHKSRLMKRWEAFRRWIGAERETHPEQGQSESQLSDCSEADQVTPRELKIYIPFKSAELCIAEIAKDLEAMKSRHLLKVQELEENLQLTVQENQEWTVQRIKSHYQSKFNSLRRILQLYQEKINKRNEEWEMKIEALTARNKQLMKEQEAERRRSKEEAQRWQKERTELLELCSSRLDLLHSQQTSTVQELRMTRQEVSRVQEMLILSAQVATEEVDSTGNQQSTSEQVAGGSQPPLEGAKACLGEQEERLQQTEIQASKDTPATHQPPCSVLLQTVILKCHELCMSATEARTLLNQMIDDNEVILNETRKKLDHLRRATEYGSDDFELNLTLLQETVQEFEVSEMALECIKTGQSPFTNCDADSEHGDVPVADPVRTSEGLKSLGHQLLLLQDKLRQEKEEKKKIIENYTSERTMRRKYYNMVEDMKGKIRVFCRIRPPANAEGVQAGAEVLKKIDDYTVAVDTSRGQREFFFDHVFGAEASQDDIFQDTSRLIQSAVDGYNVCIFAYGQTGSGKTYTMVGDKEQKHPGIMLKTFSTIFDIVQENSTKFLFKVSAHMLELYNDRLRDLLVGQPDDFQSQPQGSSRRVEIKRDRKGFVFAQGAEIREASSPLELGALFQQACANRHISATKMNIESSRSHLIVGITVESRNLTNGSLSSGKLSLVDLAGSERAAKTGARDHQLKVCQANCINKSLSVLGDVISALSAELPHVPYRNSKLTQVMQDSLGGNSKTLMIVNVSPSECNLDETLTSLIYAARVKSITNSAQRNVDSKEIAHLKEVNIIRRLRSGQTVDEDDI